MMSSAFPVATPVCLAIVRALLLPLLLILGSGSAWATGETIRVEVILRQSPTSAQPLVVEFRFAIPDGVHVYTAESHFFQYEEMTTSGLGAAVLALPPTRAIRDLLSDAPDATTPVMTGQAAVRVTKPLLAGADGQWHVSGRLRYQACTESSCYPPAKTEFAFVATAAVADASKPAAGTVAPLPTASSGQGKGTWEGRSIAWGIAAAFVAGLLLSLTPCVYPMIGITVAVIGGRQGDRRRTLWLTFLYVLAMSLTYALLGVVIALLGSTVASFLRSTWVLIPVGLVFLAMGLAMFDLFTIATPAGLAGRLQGVGRQGSAGGVFVMGAASAFVVGPCVSGPLLSLITYVATSGHILVGFLYFFALAWGMGCILFVAGSASGLLPKAGGWMETVKHALGMVLIWAGFYFTRPIIGENAFAVASVTCVAVGAGVLGLLRVPAPGSAPAVLPWVRVVCGVALVVAVTAHFLPSAEPTGGARNLPESASADVSRQIEQARRDGRPALLDFWAPWCAICKEIERQVLQKPETQEKLRNVALIKVDYDNQPELVRRYGILGPPAFVFLDGGGRQVGAVTVTAGELERRLAQGW